METGSLDIESVRGHEIVVVLLRIVVFRKNDKP